MKVFCYLTQLNTLFIVLAKPHWHLKYIMPLSHPHYLHHMTSCLKNKVLDVVQEQNSDVFWGGGVQIQAVTLNHWAIKLHKFLNEF